MRSSYSSESIQAPISRSKESIAEDSWVPRQTFPGVLKVYDHQSRVSLVETTVVPSAPSISVPSQESAATRLVERFLRLDWLND